MLSPKFTIPLGFQSNEAVAGHNKAHYQQIERIQDVEELVLNTLNREALS